MAPFLFIPENVVGVARKDKELWLAEARSHASKVSHRKRRPAEQKLRHGNQHLLDENKRCGFDEQPVDASRKLGIADIDPDPARGVKNLPSLIPRDGFGLRDDPFQCIRGSNPIYVSLAVDWFAQVTIPHVIPIYKIFNVKPYAEGMIERLTKEHFLNAVVTSVLVYQDLQRQRGEGLSPETLRSLGRTLTSVSKHLQYFTTDQTVQDRWGAPKDYTLLSSILCLASCAKVMNDMSSHDAHWQAITSLVKSAGGLDKLGSGNDDIKQALLEYDSFRALQTGRVNFKSRVPVYSPVYPQAPFPEDLRRRVSMLPKGFRELINAGKIALDVINALSRAAALHGNNGERKGVADFGLHRSRRSNNFWQACSCWHAPDEVVFESQLGDLKVVFPNFERMLIRGLMLFILYSASAARSTALMSENTRSRLAKEMSQRMAAHCQRQRSSDVHDKENGAHTASFFEWQREEDALLWIGCVLLDALRSGTGRLQPRGIEILKRMKAHFFQYTSWTNVEAKLRLFFYKKAFLERCERYWAMPAL